MIVGPKTADARVDNALDRSMLARWDGSSPKVPLLLSCEEQR